MQLLLDETFDEKHCNNIKKYFDIRIRETVAKISIYIIFISTVCGDDKIEGFWDILMLGASLEIDVVLIEELVNDLYDKNHWEKNSLYLKY